MPVEPAGHEKSHELVLKSRKKPLEQAKQRLAEEEQREQELLQVSQVRVVVLA